MADQSELTRVIQDLQTALERLRSLYNISPLVGIVQQPGVYPPSGADGGYRTKYARLIEAFINNEQGLRATLKGAITSVKAALPRVAQDVTVMPTLIDASAQIARALAPFADAGDEGWWREVLNVLYSKVPWDDKSDDEIRQLTEARYRRGPDWFQLAPPQGTT